MKKSYMLLAAFMPLSLMASSIKFTKPALTLKNDTLSIEFSMNVEEVKVNSQQSYTFTPVLRADKSEYRSLPPVVVTGERKYKLKGDEKKLGKKFGYTQPFVVIEGRDENRNDVVNYKVQIPYEEWMNHASMSLLQEGKECCETDLLNITVIEPDIAVEEPQLPQPNEICEPCMSMVSYLTPKEEPLKVRSEATMLYIEYPTSSTDFKTDYKNNGAEIEKLKSILEPLTDGDLVTFKNIKVCGYASPDGSVAGNEKVAQKRADNFALYLKGGYNFPKEILKVESAGEDWDSLIKMLNEEKPAYADKALEIIGKYSNLDVREQRLKTGLGSNYRVMLNEYFPRLRRLGISIDYEVREVENAEAARLIYTDPKMLSLQEMYRVANMYKPGTKEYEEAYEIAADNYPTDVVANINAASAAIVSGNFQKAAEYMERVKDDSRAYNNLGVLAWLSGDSETAKEWFTKALTVEPDKAQENLNKIQ